MNYWCNSVPFIDRNFENKSIDLFDVHVIFLNKEYYEFT